MRKRENFFFEFSGYLHVVFLTCFVGSIDYDRLRIFFKNDRSFDRREIRIRDRIQKIKHEKGGISSGLFFSKAKKTFFPPLMHFGKIRARRIRDVDFSRILTKFYYKITGETKKRTSPIIGPDIKIATFVFCEKRKSLGYLRRSTPRDFPTK